MNAHGDGKWADVNGGEADEEDEEESETAQEETDFYAVLNIPRDANPAQIRGSFHRLSLRFHPDKASESSTIFPRIQRAYEVLSSPESRKMYDMYGESGLQKVTVHAGKSLDKEWEEKIKRESQNSLEALVDSRGTLKINLVFARLGSPTPWIMLRSLYAAHSFHIPVNLGLPSTMPAPTTIQVGAALSARTAATPANHAEQSAVSLELRHTYSPAASFSFRVSPLSREWFGSTDLVHEKSGSFAQAQLASGRPMLVLGTRLTAWAAYYVRIAEDGISVGLRSDQWTLETGIIYIKGSIKQKVGQFVFRAAATVGLGIIDFGVGVSKRFGLARFGLAWGFGVGGIRFTLSWSRLGQKVSFPLVCQEHPDAQVLGIMIVAPLLLFGITDRYIVAPHLERRRRTRVVERRRDLQQAMELRREEASRAMEGVQNTLTAQQELARKEGGLCILSARYGSHAENADLTFALMALVNKSQLVIPAGFSKSRLVGFYDPAPLVKKHLVVVYEFRGKRARIKVGDMQALTIPMQSHMLT